MKQQLRSLGIGVSCDLLNFGSDLPDWAFRLLWCPFDSFAHWLFRVSFSGSEEEFEDAVFLEYGDRLQFYTYRQREIILAMGLLPPPLALPWKEGV